MSYSALTLQGGGSIQGPQGVPGANGPAGPAGLSYRNLLINGQPNVWQRGAGGAATFTQSAAGNLYTADRWQLKTAGTPVTVSQVAGRFPNSYAARIQRTSASTLTSQVDFGQTITRARAVASVGQYIVFSFQAKAGANLSAMPTAIIYGGTGTTDVSALSTGFTGQSVLASLQPALTTSWQAFYFAVPNTIASTTTQLAIDFQWIPVGTAGSDDSFYVTENQIEVGQVPTTFEWKDFATTLVDCLPYFQKSYIYSIAPKTNLAAGNEYFYYPAAAPPNAYKSFNFTAPMISTPSLSVYSYLASASNVLSYLTGANTYSDTLTGGAVPVIITNRSFQISNQTTANFSTTYFNGSIQWLADADLY
jgi:hypothetical protein